MNKQSGSTPEIQAGSQILPDYRDASAIADRNRRRFLVVATAAVGTAGIGAATVPFLRSLRPSAKARALGGPVTVNLKFLEPGEQITVIWRGQPVWILRRTPAMLERLQDENWVAGLRDPQSQVESQQPGYAQNANRSIRPEFLVVVALCTHLGCVPLFEPDIAARGVGKGWIGGYFCPCHGSRFDFAGRVTKNVPAPTNLVVPPHRYLTSGELEIGTDEV